MLNVNKSVEAIINDIHNGIYDDVRKVAIVKFAPVQGVRMISNTICVLGSGKIEGEAVRVADVLAAELALFSKNQIDSYVTQRRLGRQGRCNDLNH
ncbi:hypothetical protein DPQ22_02240 [Candidatus Tokpelaia sp.]|nr:hypothetical protein DPQ22_02240 [Candidatus Tokpelaia sp.]